MVAVFFDNWLLFVLDRCWRAVADALGDRAKTISLGSSIKLKGKSEGFEILRLLDLNEES